MAFEIVDNSFCLECLCAALLCVHSHIYSSIAKRCDDEDEKISEFRLRMKIGEKNGNKFEYIILESNHINT